jgi:thiol-disulfide isomerase/thioredoxin
MMKQRISPRRLAFALVGFAVIAAAGVLYVKTPGGGKETAGQCAASQAAIVRAAPLEKGEVAAATSPRKAGRLIDLQFLDGDGKPTSLAGLTGKVLLINVWATWCVPCREEMPTLDRLQAKLGSDDFRVVAINVDTTRLERARSFFGEIGVKSLEFYSDPKADVFYRLKTAGKVVGLPTTVLIGRDGCEIATLAGPADWASGDALDLIRAAL